VLTSLDADNRAFVQKVLEAETKQFYKRDRDGTGGVPYEEVRESTCSCLLLLSLQAVHLLDVVIPYTTSVSY
jgi:hypothetical protein